MTATLCPVGAAIAAAVASSAVGPARVRALRGVRWVLRSGSFYVGPIDPVTLDNPLVSERGAALVFDGRDNQETRAAFFSASFGSTFVPELV